MRATTLLKTSKKLNTNVERFLSRNTLDKALSLLDANIGMFNNFNADAHYVITNHHGKDEQRQRNDISYIQEVKNEIIKVMACAFHHSNEIGGEKKDANAIDLCNHLTSDLDSAKTRYKYQTISIQVLVRLIMISITITTIVTVFCLGKDAVITFNDESGKRDIQIFELEGKKWCRGPLLISMDSIGLVLYIIAAAVQVLGKAFRPDANFANLLLTQHLIESEKFF